MKKIILLTSFVAISLQGMQHQQGRHDQVPFGQGRDGYNSPGTAQSMDQNAYHLIASGQQVNDVSSVEQQYRVSQDCNIVPKIGRIGDGKASVNHISFVVGAVFIKNSQSPYSALSKQSVDFINHSMIFNSSKKNPELKGCDLRFMQSMPQQIHCVAANGSLMVLDRIDFGLRLLQCLHTKNEVGVRALAAWLTPEQMIPVLGGAQPYMTQSGLQTYQNIMQSNHPLFLRGISIPMESLRKEFDRISAEALSIAKALSDEARKAAANAISRAKIQIDEKIGGFYGITTGILISIVAYFAFLRNK